MTDHEVMNARLQGLEKLMEQAKAEQERRLDKIESNTRWAFLTIGALVIQAAFTLLSNGVLP